MKIIFDKNGIKWPSNYMWSYTAGTYIWWFRYLYFVYKNVSIKYVYMHFGTPTYYTWWFHDIKRQVWYKSERYHLTSDTICLNAMAVMSILYFLPYVLFRYAPGCSNAMANSSPSLFCTSVSNCINLTANFNSSNSVRRRSDDETTTVRILDRSAPSCLLLHSHHMWTASRRCGRLCVMWL